MATITGTSAFETLTGTEDDDLIFGLRGDTLIGGLGDDTLSSGGRSGLLFGGDGNDSLVGRDFSELFGGDGDDVLRGNGSGLVLSGEDGDDLIVSRGRNIVLGGEGDDELRGFFASVDLRGDAGDDILRGGVGDDSLFGGTGADTLFGNEGSDRLTASGSGSVLYGGSGDDSYFIHGSGIRIVESLVATDFDSAIVMVDFFGVGSGIDLLYVDDSVSEGLKLIGVLNTFGGVGDDTLDGGEGSLLDGLGGDDVIIVRADTEFFGGSGYDTALAHVTTTLVGSSIEALFLQTRDAIDGTGDAGRNTIIGNMADNTIDGGRGRDALIGQGGADTFVFSNLTVARESDRVGDFASGEDHIALSLSGLGIDGTIGALDANAFVAGTTAQDADDRLIFDAATGRLWVDADGSGGGAMVRIATLVNGADLVADDVFWIA